MHGERFLGVFRLAGHGGAVAAYIAHLVIVLRAAGCQREGQHSDQQQCYQFLCVHIRSS